MTDILLVSDGDIALAQGDMLWADATIATDQHIADIMQASQGDYKASPLVGVGLLNYLNGEENSMLLRDISRQLQRDGVRVASIEVDENGKILIDGTYDTTNNSR